MLGSQACKSLTSPPARQSLPSGQAKYRQVGRGLPKVFHMPATVTGFCGACGGYTNMGDALRCTTERDAMSCLTESVAELGHPNSDDAKPAQTLHGRRLECRVPEPDYHKSPSEALAMSAHRLASFHGALGSFFNFPSLKSPQIASALEPPRWSAEALSRKLLPLKTCRPGTLCSSCAALCQGFRRERNEGSKSHRQ